MEASGIVKTVGGLGSAIPFVGGAIGAIGSVIGGVLEQNEAKKQAEQAEKMRRDALNQQKQGIRPEFLQKQKMDTMLALAGLPNYNLYGQEIDYNTASNLRSIRESSPGGAATLAAISAANGLAAENKRKLQMSNAEARLAGLKQVSNTTWDIGEKQRGLEDIRDQMKREGLSSAAAMENAATFNKVNSIKQMVGGITTGANQLSTNAITMNDQAQKNALQEQYLKYLQGLGGNLNATPNTAIPQPFNFSTTGLPANNPTAPLANTSTSLNLPVNSFWGSNW